MVNFAHHTVEHTLSLGVLTWIAVGVVAASGLIAAIYAIKQRSNR